MEWVRLTDSRERARLIPKETQSMKWVKPEFKDIPLSMEVTAYANTDVDN